MPHIPETRTAVRLTTPLDKVRGFSAIRTDKPYYTQKEITSQTD